MKTYSHMALISTTEGLRVCCNEEEENKNYSRFHYEWIENHQFFEIGSDEDKEKIVKMVHAKWERDTIGDAFEIWQESISKGIDCSEFVGIRGECETCKYSSSICSSSFHCCKITYKAFFKEPLQEIWGDDEDGKYEDLYNKHNKPTEEKEEGRFIKGLEYSNDITGGNSKTFIGLQYAEDYKSNKTLRTIDETQAILMDLHFVLVNEGIESVKQKFKIERR